MAYRTQHYSVYEQVLEGPTEQEVEAARNVLKAAAKAEEDSIAGSIIYCEECDGVAPAKKWKLIRLYRESASFYERSRYIHRTVLECPACAHRAFFEYNRPHAERMGAYIPTIDEEDGDEYV